MLKWVLSFSESNEYKGKEPSANAFIDDLELCNLHFANETSQEGYSSSEIITTINYNKSNITQEQNLTINYNKSNITQEQNLSKTIINGHYLEIK
jgi:hypothetical protein